MKHFFYQLSLCFFLITSCGAMEKIWHKDGNEVTAQDYRGFLEKRGLEISEEEFALFTAGLAFLDREKDQRQHIFQDSGSEDDGTQVLIKRLEEDQSKKK